jgi:hypothetical protein
MMQLDQIIIDNIVLLYLGLGSAHGTTLGAYRRSSFIVSLSRRATVRFMYILSISERRDIRAQKLECKRNLERCICSFSYLSAIVSMV